jgi:23S rRNA (uridine2552-2'-O)-methyltransferase
MAPNLSGNSTVDAARVEYIIELAVAFSKAHLKPGGSLLVKCFHGPSYNNIVNIFKDEFKVVMNKNLRRAKINHRRFFVGKRLKAS